MIMTKGLLKSIIYRRKNKKITATKPNIDELTPTDSDFIVDLRPHDEIPPQPKPKREDK